MPTDKKLHHHKSVYYAEANSFADAWGSFPIWSIVNLVDLMRIFLRFDLVPVISPNLVSEMFVAVIVVQTFCKVKYKVVVRKVILRYFKKI